MSTEVMVHERTAYSAGFEMLAQQMEHKLRPYVRNESETGDRVNFPQIGPVGPRQKTERHGETQYVTTPHKKRWVFPEAFEFADLVDLADVKRIVADPGGEYSRNFIASINRDRDRQILANAIGTAYIGVNGTTSQAMTAANQLGAAGTGMTLAKVKNALKRLKAGNGVDGTEECVIAWTSFQENEFLDATEVKSHDYNTQRVLIDGGMGDGKFIGFRYVRLEDWVDEGGTTRRIVPYTSGTTTRSCVAWVKSGLLHNTWTAPMTKVDQLPGRNYSWQHWVHAQYGTTRMQEAKVVQIDCIEA